VSSFDLGHALPDPEAYRTALGMLGLSAEATAFVSHDAHELAGAAAVGMATIAVNHQSGAVADVYLDELAQLADVVRGWPAMHAAG
jgi:FMN phosphatase YigB (HAD superfamily)